MDITSVLTIALVSLLGAMSPGPDFAIITKNCLSGSFRSGVVTALGVISALSIHVTYCVFGIALVIMETPLLFLGLKYLGAAYLFYLGIKMLLEKNSSPEGAANEIPAQSKKKQRPFVSGFLCNLLNPKCMLFILSLFTQFIDQDASFLQKLSLGSVMVVVSLIWFVSLSYLITHRFLQKHFARFKYIITKTMGAALCLLALSVAIF
jgi:RhtB (resistance to homoserine/threonine) family protein